MSQKISAGILLFRLVNLQVEVLLVHPGGPFWAGKQLGAWTIPKGMVQEGEGLVAAAQREFFEETGTKVSGNFIPLPPLKLKSGKTIVAFALNQDMDATKIQSNAFEIEWPPHSGKMREFPEVDSAAWFSLQEAKQKINQGQAGLLEELKQRIAL